MIDFNKQYDLESRTYNFSINTIGFVKSLQKLSVDNEYTNQLIKSAGDLGTCFIDLQEEPQSDIISVIRICRKKAAESFELLKRIDCSEDLMDVKANLTLEASDFMKIFDKFLNQRQLEC